MNRPDPDPEAERNPIPEGWYDDQGLTWFADPAGVGEWIAEVLGTEDA